MSDSVIVKRLLKIREEAPTRRKRIAKSALPELKAEQFVGKKRDVAKEKAKLASALKDKLLKAQYDVADKKLNARKKSAKAEFAEMNIADTPERRGAREAKEATQLALKNAPSTQQKLLEYLRENESATKKAGRQLALLSQLVTQKQRNERRAGRPQGSKNKPKAKIDAETAALINAFPPPQAQVGSPASTITGERPKTQTQLKRAETAAKKKAQKALDDINKVADKARKGRVPEVITATPTGALSTTPARALSATKSRILPATPTAGVPPAVAKASGSGSEYETDTGEGFNRALIGKGEQLRAGKDKVYMSETMAHLDTLNRHNQRTIIPRNDIVAVERFINTTLENKAIRGGPF